MPLPLSGHLLALQPRTRTSWGASENEVLRVQKRRTFELVAALVARNPARIIDLAQQEDQPK